MNRQSHQSVRQIKARNRRVLEHVARYRLTTVEALRRVVMPGLSANAVSKTVNRICDSGLLAGRVSQPLSGPLEVQLDLYPPDRRCLSLMS